VSDEKIRLYLLPSEEPSHSEEKLEGLALTSPSPAAGLELQSL
jgi:hypothetical protein